MQDRHLARAHAQAIVPGRTARLAKRAASLIRGFTLERHSPSSRPALVTFVSTGVSELYARFGTP